MKYNFDDLHWQEFEILSFKTLQILIAKDIQFLEGGSDKGRDLVYDGSSNFNESYSGKWVFQVKHKSKAYIDNELATTLDQDLKTELKKVFVTNRLKYDNYILVTNKTISASLFDQLHNTYSDFITKNKIDCHNFNIISYRHIESCFDNNESLKWSYPNVINHSDFLLLLKDAINYNLENRKRGWLNGLNKQREKFVYTQFYEKANEKLANFPAIILSGPPKSGKTFNAEMLALNYSIFKNFQPVLIDSPEEIEEAFELDRQQIFICDDAFGKFGLTYKAEEWFLKLDRIFNLADESHLFIFTSREYIFRAFINFGNESAKSFLEKIIVESHNYLSYEKLAILKRYTVNSTLSYYDKVSIIEDEIALTNHKNFSPETIRAFFSNINEVKRNEQLKELRAHLDKPDSYLSTVFFKLPDIKKAVLLSVLCTVKNSERSIYKSFDNICEDLDITEIFNSVIEFDELDDSILRIQKTDVIEEINFYHPSMQEFLTRQLISNESGKLRQVVLQNLNNDLLSISVMKSMGSSVLTVSTDDKIRLQKSDIDRIQIGLDRLINNEEISIYQVASLFKWFKSEIHSIELKLSDTLFFKNAKEIVSKLTSDIASEGFYLLHRTESSSAWSYLLFVLKNTLTLYGLDNNPNFSYIEKILKEKEKDELYWMLVFRVLNITNDQFLMNTVGKDWLNTFYTQLKKDIYDLGHEIFGNEFPLFENYHDSIKKGIKVDKIKEKPNKSWYPRFLIVKEKFDILKEVRGSRIGNTILERLSKEYEELMKQREFAKNRHGFNLKQGWWRE
jgi:hypothetical protein